MSKPQVFKFSIYRIATEYFNSAGYLRHLDVYVAAPSFKDAAQFARAFVKKKRKVPGKVTVYFHDSYRIIRGNDLHWAI